jgi:hypothetical protein
MKCTIDQVSILLYSFVFFKIVCLHIFLTSLCVTVLTIFLRNQFCSLFSWHWCLSIVIERHHISLFFTTIQHPHFLSSFILIFSLLNQLVLWFSIKDIRWRTQSHPCSFCNNFIYKIFTNNSYFLLSRCLVPVTSKRVINSDIRISTCSDQSSLRMGCFDNTSLNLQRLI